MSGRLRLTTIALIGALAGPAAVALAFAPPLAAQTISNTFGGLSESSKDPIDIESDLLVVHDKEKYATFSGSVKAVQGTTTLQAKELNVHYVGGDRLAPGGAKKEGEAEAAPATKVAEAEGAGGAAAGATTAADKGTQITKIEAKGEVVITSKDDQTTTSDWALYDLPSQLVTVAGNVVLTQGKNVLKGDRLVIDLKTGESRFENTGNTAAGGRIRALFMPKQEGGDDAKSGDAQPGDAKSGETKSGETKSGETKSGETESGAAAKDETSAREKPDADAGDKSQDDGEPSADTAWPLSPEMRP
jgi:lipopolysaccharide export system protein LptA